MRFLLAASAILLAGFLMARAQPPEPSLSPEELRRLRSVLSPEPSNWSPAYVLERCAEHLATLPQPVRCRIRYFDMSDVPQAVLPAATASLLFGCVSASSVTTIDPPRPVPGTDNRIFWIDLAWYNWDPETWEEISGEDPYFREPIIPSQSPGLAFLKQETQANPVVRGSWFTFYVYDTTLFLKKNEQRADDAFYYKLVYGSRVVDKEIEEIVQVKTTEVKQATGKDETGRHAFRFENVEAVKSVPKKVRKRVRESAVPKTAKEFEDFWKVDFGLLKEFPIDQGAVVDENRSFVSYSNRVLWRVRTGLGVYWRTFDVFSSAGDQDFVENPFPREFDAGEHIVQDSRGAQFYFLTDGKGNRVEFGDPRVVRDSTSSEKTIVVTGRSCIQCHEAGIIAFRNEMPELLKSGLDLRSYGHERNERIKQFFLQDKKMQKLVKHDQENYVDFVRECNGLSSQENAAQFARLRTWYASPVNAEQAARELGCEPQELKDALGLLATKGRLGRLALTGEAVPRQIWERGGFAEAGLLLLEHRKRSKINH